MFSQAALIQSRIASFRFSWHLSGSASQSWAGSRTQPPSSQPSIPLGTFPVRSISPSTACQMPSHEGVLNSSLLFSAWSTPYRSTLMW